LQSQVTKTARKRLSLSGLEVLHGRLKRSLLASLFALSPTQKALCQLFVVLGLRPQPDYRKN
jgi:hypothetical protein